MPMVSSPTTLFLSPSSFVMERQATICITVLLLVTAFLYLLELFFQKLLALVRILVLIASFSLAARHSLGATQTLATYYRQSLPNGRSIHDLSQTARDSVLWVAGVVVRASSVKSNGRRPTEQYEGVGDTRSRATKC